MRIHLQLSIALCTVFVFVLIPQNRVFANEVTASPFFVDLVAQPGEQVQTPITIRNTGNKPIVLEISVHDFIGRPTTKEPLYTPNPEYSLKNWFRDSNLQPTITIPADRSVDYLATFNVPQGVSDKTYFGGVFFTNDNDQPTSIATNVYISVGNPSANIEITGLNHELRESFDVIRSFVSFTINNNGTALFSSSINDWHVVAYNNSDDEVYKQTISEGFRLLPGSSYNYALELDKPLPEESVRLVVQYSGQPAQKTSQSVAILQSATVNDSPVEDTDFQPAQTSNSYRWLTWIAGAMGLLSIVSGLVLRKRRLHQQPGTQTKEDNKA